MSYHVKVHMFEGPFDLLLHLIAKRELDVYELPLGEITEEYLDHIRDMQDLDLEVATEFLVVAATLIEIKAGRLLPGPQIDDEDALASTERDLLLARLLEYRAFKDAAGALEDGFAKNAGFIGRMAGPGREYDHLCPDLLARVSPANLVALAEAALAPKVVPVLDLSHITPIRVSVAEAIREVLRVLALRPSISFRELSKDCDSRIDLVVRFLAVLELIKRGEADVNQPVNFGRIDVTRLQGPNPSEIVIDAIDEYDGLPTIELDVSEDRVRT